MPFIATAISAVGSAFAAGGVFATGGALSIVGRLLVTVAFSALRQALTDQPSTTTPGIRNERTQSGGVNPATFILGRYATGGAAVCPEMSYGLLTATGGAPNTPNEFLVYVIDLGDIPGGTGLEQVIIDGTTVPLGSAPEYLPALEASPAVSKGLPGTGLYANKLWVKFKDGTDTEADPYLRRVFGGYPERPWTADMIGRGVPHVIVTFRRDPTLYNSFPQCRFVVGGIPLYDWRKDSSVGGAGSHRWDNPATWQPTENPIVQIYNVLRGIPLMGGFVWGGKSVAAAFRLPEWTIEANSCDTAIALSGGGGEPQFRAGLEVSVFDEPATIIEDILRGCTGKIAEVGGIWRVRVGAPALPVWSFGDDDVIISSQQDLAPFPSLSNTYNAVTATFPDPEMGWEPTEAPARYNTDWEALDQDRRLPADLNLTATPYGNQVQRVMRAYIEGERRFATHILTLPPEAGLLEPLDTTGWASTLNGYLGKQFEIVEVAHDLFSGNAQLSLREVDPSDYDWVPGFELPFNRPSTAIVARTQAYVGSATAIGISLNDAASTARRPAIKLSWEAPSTGLFRGLEWELRLDGQTGARTGTTQAIGMGEIIIADGILPATGYQIRCRWVADQEAAWTPWLPVTTPDVRLGAPDLAVEIVDAIAIAQSDIEAANDQIIAAQAQIAANAQIADSATAAQAATNAVVAIAQGDIEAEAAAIRAELAQDVRARVPVEVETSTAIEQLAERVAGLVASASELQSRVSGAGIIVDPANGRVTIEGVSRLDAELGETRIALDALAGSITILASKTYVDGAISGAILDPSQIPIIGDLDLRLNTAALAIDAAQSAISGKADSLALDAQGLRLTSAEANLDGLNAAIELKASTTELTSVNTRLTTAEASLTTIDGAGIQIALTDTRRLSRDAEDQAAVTIADVLRGVTTRDDLRQDLAYLRQDFTAMVSEDREAIAGVRTELGTAVADSQARLIEEQTARTTADQAEAVQRLALASRVDGLNADLGAASTAITGLTTRTETVEGSLVTQANALTALTSTLSNPITGLVATNATLGDLATTMANADNAIASRTTNLESTVLSASTGLAATKAATDAAQAAATAAAVLAGAKGEVYYGPSPAPAALRAAQNLWIRSDNGQNTPYRWDGTAWQPVTDKIALDASTAAAAALAALNHPTTGLVATRAQMTTADATNASATSAVASRVTGLEATVNDGTAGLLATRSQMTTADAVNASLTQALASRTTSLESTVLSASTGLAATKAATDAAQAAATAAAVLAGAKGEVYYGPSPAPAALRAAQNQWIRSDNGQNTPYRWDGTTWLPVTDQIAIDASTAATAALAALNHPTTGLVATRAQMTATDTALATATDAVASRASALEATAGNLTASVSQQSTALATLQGNAAASYVLRARAGGTVGELEVVAGDNIGGAASLVRIKSDRFRFEGNLAEFLGAVKVDTLNIAGEAVTVRSYAYVNDPIGITPNIVDLCQVTVNRKNGFPTQIQFSAQVDTDSSNANGVAAFYVYRNINGVAELFGGPFRQTIGDNGLPTATGFSVVDFDTRSGVTQYRVAALSLPGAIGYSANCRAFYQTLPAQQFQR